MNKIIAVIRLQLYAGNTHSCITAYGLERPVRYEPLTRRAYSVHHTKRDKIFHFISQASPVPWFSGAATRRGRMGHLGISLAKRKMEFSQRSLCALPLFIHGTTSHLSLHPYTTSINLVWLNHLPGPYCEPPLPVAQPSVIILRHT